MTVLDWALLAGYFVLLIVIGVQTIRRVRTADDFAVAGNRIIWPVFFGSLAASFLGGGASLGVAGKTFSDGYVYMFAFFGYAVSFLLIGLFVAPRLKRYLGAHTVGDIMEEHYGRGARLITGVLSILLCAGILGAQALAIGTVVNATLQLPTVPSVIVGMGVVVLYSSFGGAWAVIQTDMLQFVFLGVFIPVTLVLALGEVGGPAGLLASLPEAHLTFGGGYGALMFIGLFVSFLLGETLVPPYAQRTFSTPDSRHARIGFAMSGGFAFLFYFIAVVFVKDIYQPFVSPQVSAQKKLWLERGLSLGVGVVATLFALSVPSIVDALLYSYTFWAPTIVIPLLAAVLLGSRAKAAALSAIAAGAGVGARGVLFLPGSTPP